MRRSFPAAVVAAVGLVSLAPARAAAAVVVLANATADPVRVTVTTPGRAAAVYQLASAEVRPVPCGRHADVAFDRAGAVSRLRLDAYAAYIFVARKGVTDLYGIEQVGKPVPADDIPVKPPSPADPLRIPVKLLADDADRRTQPAWERAVRARFNAAAAVVAAHCPVTFEVVEVDEWATDPAATLLSGLYSEFQRAVKPAPARLAVGVTSRLPRGVGGGYAVTGRAAFSPHILVREGDPRSEPERVEVLIQQLGKHLGAVHSADPGSAMRTKLGDGKATIARFRLGFDPLNTLAMNIWVEEARAVKATKLTDLRPAAQARLGRIYATLANALPDEQLPVDYMAAAAKAEGRGADGPRVAAAPGREEPPPGQVEMPRPPARQDRQPDADPAPAAPGRPEKTLTPKQEAARKVVRAIVQRAEQNAAAANRARGDALTELYIRTAADIARFEDKDVRPAAFLLGLGIALDDSEILRKNPLSESFCRAVESDEERKARLVVIGLPTVRDRRDLCQHFVVSAALTELVGGVLAEQAGLFKEKLDMTRASGFSFTDLCADLAGVAFARFTKKDPDLLEQWWQDFRLVDYVPKLDGLRDGLTEERFKQDYGSFGDERFKRVMDDLRKRVREQRFYGSLEK